MVKTGYLVTITYKVGLGKLAHDAECRTYACVDRESYDELILRLTGRGSNSYPLNSDGIPSIHTENFKVRTAYPLHVYGVDE